MPQSLNFTHMNNKITLIKSLTLILVIFGAVNMGFGQTALAKEDIAIIGFTSGLISKFTSPALTCVEQHGFLMGKQAAELLINRIENNAPLVFQKEVISTNLKIRKSTSLDF